MTTTITYDGNKYPISFCGEPTSDGDERARVIRKYYEDHRESFWDRHSRLGGMIRDGVVADNFILGLMEFVGLVDDAYKQFEAGKQ